MARAVRSAPTLDVDGIVSATGGSRRGVLKGLRSTSGRGRCDQALLAGFEKLSADGRALTACGSFASPPLVRLASLDNSATATDQLAEAASGPAAWPIRSAEHPGRTRYGAGLAAWRGAEAAQIRFREIVERDPTLPRAVLHRSVRRSQSLFVCPGAFNRRRPRYALGRFAAGATMRSAESGSPLERLACSTDEKARVVAAADRTCPRQTLEHLAADEHPAVRAAVAANESCAEGLLWTLGQDRASSVRDAAARNRACPQRLLGSLAHDLSGQARRQVAFNESCPPQIIGVLVGDDDRSVRSAVSTSPLCSPEMFERLLSARSGEPPVVQIAQNPACPMEHLETWATAYDAELREAVAANPSLPTHLMQSLTLDHAPKVAVAAVTALRRARRNQYRSATDTTTGPLEPV